MLLMKDFLGRPVRGTTQFITLSIITLTDALLYVQQGASPPWGRNPMLRIRFEGLVTGSNKLFQGSGFLSGLGFRVMILVLVFR